MGTDRADKNELIPVGFLRHHLLTLSRGKKKTHVKFQIRFQVGQSGLLQ